MLWAATQWISGEFYCRCCKMSNNRPLQSSGGASSVPSTSSSSSSSGTGGTGNSNGGGGGSNAVPSNGNSSGNLVPSRTLTAATEGGLSVPSLAAVPSSRGGFASLCRPSASSGSRKKSLHQTPLYNGLLNSYEDKSNDFVWWVFFCESAPQPCLKYELKSCDFFFFFLQSTMFSVCIPQPHLFRNDWRGTHDQVWAQFLVSLEACWLLAVSRCKNPPKLAVWLFTQCS